MKNYQKKLFCLFVSFNFLFLENLTALNLASTVPQIFSSATTQRTTTPEGTLDRSFLVARPAVAVENSGDLKSPEEIKELFRKAAEAITNTVPQILSSATTQRTTTPEGTLDRSFLVARPAVAVENSGDLKSPEEIKELFRKAAEAITNTVPQILSSATTNADIISSDLLNTTTEASTTTDAATESIFGLISTDQLNATTNAATESIFRLISSATTDADIISLDPSNTTTDANTTSDTGNALKIALPVVAGAVAVFIYAGFRIWNRYKMYLKEKEDKDVELYYRPSVPGEVEDV